MATSIFDKKDQQPDEDSVEKVLKSNYSVWEQLIEYLHDKHEVIETEWKFYSKNSGWCLKISNEKGKNLIFLLPNDNYFIATINMSVKIKELVLQANISTDNKKLVGDSKIYMEGISVLFMVNDKIDLEDVKTILSIRDNY